MSDINLKSIPQEKDEEKDGFEVHNIDEKEDLHADTKVKIKFGKFVELVAKHSFIDVIDKNQDQEIIIDANLLTDLANSDDDEKQLPYQKYILVGFGIVVGILITLMIVK